MTTHKRHFNKPPTTIKQQIALLKSNGIQIQSENLATHYLQFIGYYRLLGYMRSFRTHNKIYTKGSTFEDVVDHYIFDKKVRILLFDAIEPIEVAIRSAITSVMTEHYGAFWFTKKKLFVSHIGTKQRLRLSPRQMW